MDRNLAYGAAGCFAGTLISYVVISYNPAPLLLVLIPMWGMVMGISISRVIGEESRAVKRAAKKK